MCRFSILAIIFFEKPCQLCQKHVPNAMQMYMYGNQYVIVVATILYSSVKFQLKQTSFIISVNMHALQCKAPSASAFIGFAIQHENQLLNQTRPTYFEQSCLISRGKKTRVSMVNNSSGMCHECEIIVANVIFTSACSSVAIYGSVIMLMCLYKKPKASYIIIIPWCRRTDSCIVVILI